MTISHIFSAACSERRLVVRRARLVLQVLSWSPRGSRRLPGRPSLPVLG